MTDAYAFQQGEIISIWGSRLMILPNTVPVGRRNVMHTMAQHETGACLHTMAYELQRTVDEHYARDLMGSPSTIPPINGFFSTMVTMFALFDHCAVFLADVADMPNPTSAEFFGPRFLTLVTHLRQHAPTFDEHVRRLGYNEFEESHREPWADTLCKIRNRFIHRQSMMFQEDVDGMQRVLGHAGQTSRTISEFLVFAARKLTELAILCKLATNV